MTDDSGGATSTNPTTTLHEATFAARVRRGRYVLLLVVLGMTYLFIWLPWKVSPISFFIFLGFGLIQTAGIYCQDNGPSRAPDVPPLFLNRIVCVLVMILGLLGLISEFVIGFRSKPWWEALLLPVPPFIVTGIWFVRHNPAPPFFVGIAALVAAFAVFIALTFLR